MEIAVRAAGLSYKDVLNATGSLPPNAVADGLTGHRLGLEVAGRVLRTGSSVEHVRQGDEVIARVHMFDANCAPCSASSWTKRTTSSRVIPAVCTRMSMIARAMFSSCFSK